MTMGDQLEIFGGQNDINVFLTYLYMQEKAEEPRRQLDQLEIKHAQELEKRGKIFFSNRDNSSQKILFPVCLKFKDGIDSLQVISSNRSIEFEFDHNWIHLKGNSMNIALAQSDIKEIEAKIKLSFYPKYWDHKQKSNFKLYEIPDSTLEFQEVLSDFNKTMKDVEIVKLLRVQNLEMMEKYIHFQQKWHENHPFESITRLKLFHGTRKFPPQKLVEGEIGLDLQFAANGLYGKGIYFAVHASYSNIYGHHTETGTIQILIFDALVGNSYSMNSHERNIRHAPEGNDSVFARADNFYIIYKNYHCYPLYIIEYRIPKCIPQDSKFQMSNVMPIFRQIQSFSNGGFNNFTGISFGLNNQNYGNTKK